MLPVESKGAGRLSMTVTRMLSVCRHAKLSTTETIYSVVFVGFAVGTAQSVHESPVVGVQEYFKALPLLKVIDHRVKVSIYTPRTPDDNNCQLPFIVAPLSIFHVLAPPTG